MDVASGIILTTNGMNGINSRINKNISYVYNELTSANRINHDTRTINNGMSW